MSTQTSMSAAGLVAVVLKRDSLMAVGPLVGFSVSAGGTKHMCSTGKWLFGENRVNGVVWLCSKTSRSHPEPSGQ